MKKILLLVIAFLFSITYANATTTFVNFNNAGVPITVTRGYSKPVSIARAYGYGNYARPAQPSMPARPAMPYGYRTRNAYIPPSLTNYNFPAPVQSPTIPQQTSRLNKNYNAVIPQKSYTMNGVTYYN